MKKALVLGAIAALGSLAFGCAMTDYSNTPITPSANKSHGVIDCVSMDRTANTQQTAEPGMTQLLYTQGTAGPGTGGNGNTVCPGFGPAVSSVNVSKADAKDWQRFVGIHHFNTEAQVFGAPASSGTWAMASVKDLSDGSRRISTYYSPNTGAFSCNTGGPGFNDAGPEGMHIGSSSVFGGPIAAPWGPETVALDNNAGAQFCTNIAAVSATRAAAGNYSTFLGFLGRAVEGHLYATPITRRAGLMEFLSGSQLTVEHAGVQFTAHANLLETGEVEVFVDALSHEGVTYEAVNPIRVVVNPANNFRTFEVDVVNREDELANLARFALDAGLTDRQLTVGGVIPELGISTLEREILIVGQALEDYINGQFGGPIDG